MSEVKIYVKENDNNSLYWFEGKYMINGGYYCERISEDTLRIPETDTLLRYVVDVPPSLEKECVYTHENGGDCPRARKKVKKILEKEKLDGTPKPKDKVIKTRNGTVELNTDWLEEGILSLKVWDQGGFDGSPPEFIEVELDRKNICVLFKELEKILNTTEEKE